MHVNTLPLVALLTTCSVVAAAAETVNVSNWNGYIAPDTLVDFTRVSGIQATYDIHDSNKVLESRLIPATVAMTW